MRKNCNCTAEEVNKYTSAFRQLIVTATESEFDKKWKRIKEEWDKGVW